MEHEPLPGASTALTMGIISIVGNFVCCGPFAIIFSIIGLSKAKSAERLYNEDPDRYSGSENIRTGRILSYIGLGLSLITIILTIVYFGFIIAFIGLNGDF